MFLDPKKILNHLRIPFGARVADFGAGKGDFSLAALERLEGNGAVYALDAFAPNLDSLMKEATRRNARLYTLSSDLNAHIPLADNLFKAGIAANILHQLKDRDRFVDEVKRVIEPGGEVLVVDWVSSFRNMGPTEEAVVVPARAAELFSRAGFVVDSMLPAGSHHFAFIAKHPPA